MPTPVQGKTRRRPAGEEQPAAPVALLTAGRRPWLLFFARLSAHRASERLAKEKKSFF